MAYDWRYDTGAPDWASKHEADLSRRAAKQRQRRNWFERVFIAVSKFMGFASRSGDFNRKV